jgi:outer membrane protein assembly factor BamB
VAYDATTGAVLWARRYKGPADQDDNATGVGVSPDGRTVFVIGDSWGTYPDYATVAYDASTGAALWVSRYNGPRTAPNTRRPSE